MTTLLEKLINETQILKIEYLDKMEKFSHKRFDQAKIQSSYKDLDWVNYFGLTPEIHNAGRIGEFKGFPKGFYNTPLSRSYNNMKSENYRILQMGLEAFILKNKKSAELHYLSSIEKLSIRIQKKELNESKIEMITGKVGVNIETIITDGSKTVKAWTIIAEGPIQQPHYRYLIK